MSRSPTSSVRTQEERSATTKACLVEAATASLIEHGYAHTTAVEVCQRAGLTRGAFHHHYCGIAELLVAVLEHLYERMRASDEESEPSSLETLIREGWLRISRPEFKAVIEIWLAARNDVELGRTLGPAITQLSRLFSPEATPNVSTRHADSDAGRAAFYRLVFEAMIGLGLGRATSPGGGPVAHESEVVELLVSLSRAYERS